MGKTELQDQLQYLAFGEIYQRFSEPGARRKAFTIVEATLQCVSRKGFDGVTMTMIAREAAVARTLIGHYFEKESELKISSLKYVRLVFQSYVLERVNKAKTPTEMLRAYIAACFQWVNAYRLHSLVWLAFLHRSSRNKEWREINTVAVRAGEERIASLIELGKTTGSFHCSDAELAAKKIQILITGGLVSYVSEELVSPEQFVVTIQSAALEFVTVKP